MVYGYGDSQLAVVTGDGFGFEASVNELERALFFFVVDEPNNGIA